jgi:hypothetical protein
VTEENSRDSGKAKKRGHSLDVMLAVNDIGSDSHRIEIVYDRHGRRAHLLGHFSQPRAVGDGSMAATDKFKGEVSRVEF